ncbi:MAG: flagellar hook-associated protein FlgK [Deltaproteobacteria bacterium]|nr:flagellar hook-associated protein FlgK [Deltaproteobacteria bacterium]MBW2073203.1 flagellar hook-associated protein FlgK [Deltaproteobacteria bacterium]
MSGLGLVLSIAKDAVAAQQYGLDVVGHNIANVNTPGYSRQRAVHEAKEPAPYGGVLLGRGVDTTQVVRATDQFIENQLMEQKSSMFSFKEMENYMQVLEGLFNENSDSSISALMADFWNTWHDVAINPSGGAERVALYEHSVLLSDQFKALNTDLIQLETDLTNAISAGINRINEITNEIAQINNNIVGMEVTSTANDLRDQRNVLVSELSEYTDIKTFEQSNGSLTVVAAKGTILVHGNDSYDLALGGDDGRRVEWQGSGGATVDLTDYISNGKLGGWLDMREEVIAKYKKDLDALVKEFVWTVNQQHSQGVGLEGFSSVTGTYQASSTSAALDSSGLGFASEIIDGGFRLWLYDSNGDYDSDTTLTIDASVTSIDDIVTAIDAIDPNITATTIDGKIQISASNGYTFAFSDDTSNVLAALGINTFFAGTTAGSIEVNDKIDSNKNYITAAQVINNVGPAVANSSNDPTGTGTIVTSGHYTGTADATYEIQISTGGAVGVAQFQWRKDGGAWSAPILTTGGAQAIDVDGVSVTFMPGTYVANDTFTIDVTADSAFYGTYASGDNTNAMAIADLQYTAMDIAQWTCDRRNGDTEGSVNATIEDYYHAMVGSMGIKSASISRGRAFGEVMVNKMGEIRDSISAVSLDEEMTNLIKFQHAYAAAAKLIRISDEMLNTLLSVK